MPHQPDTETHDETKVHPDNQDRVSNATDQLLELLRRHHPDLDHPGVQDVKLRRKP